MSTSRICLSNRKPPDQGKLVSVRPRLKAPSKGGNTDESKSGTEGLLSLDDDLSSQSSSVPNQVPRLRALLDSEFAKVTSSSSASSSVASFEPDLMSLQPPQQIPMPTMSERDLKIKLLEEELNLTKKMAELERRKKEANLMDVRGANGNNDPLSGFGSISDLEVVRPSREGELMFQQIENARRDEISRLRNEKSKDSSSKTNDNKVTKQKIRQMLERKKKEMELRNELVNSAATLQERMGNVDTQEIFESEDETDSENSSQIASAVQSVNYERNVDDQRRADCDDMDSFLGENAREQQKIWEKIQRERREEEEKLKGMKHEEVVKEQEFILRQIQQQNISKKKEEELTFKLIAELSMKDQQEVMYSSLGASTTKAPATRPPVPTTFSRPESYSPAGAWGGDGWSVVGEKAKEKMASLKYAAEMDLRKKQSAAQAEAMQEWRRNMMLREEEERRRQLRQWEGSQKVKVVKNSEKFQESDDVKNGPTLSEFLEECTSQSRGSRGKSKEGHGGNRELGARRKSDGWQESSRGRRRLSENQKLRVDTQEREYLARAEQVALAQEWENATRRKEAREASGSRVQEEVGQKAKNKKYLNQKTRQK